MFGGRIKRGEQVAEMNAGKLNLTVREVAMILCVFISGAGTIVICAAAGSAWKESIEGKQQEIQDKLQLHQNQLDEIERKLQWLIDHNPDVKESPLKGTPRSQSQYPHLRVQLPQDAGNPAPYAAMNK